MKPDLKAALQDLGELSLPSLSDMSAAELPDVLPAPAAKDSPLDASDELDQLTGLALKRTREILEEPIDFDNDKMVRATLSAINTVLNTQVRVDEGRLKRRKLDALPKLLEILAREESRMERVAGLLDV